MTTYNIRPNDGRVRIKFGLYKHKKRQGKSLPKTPKDGCGGEAEVSDRQTQVSDSR
jgi:hypothetical protein